MAKLVLGSNPETIEKEEAEKIRKLDEEVRERQKEQSLRLQRFAKKYKRNKVFILVLFYFIVLGLFGGCIYMAFFKQNITEEDVTSIAKKQTASFNASGVDGYVRKNFNTWYEMLLAGKSEKIEYIRPNLNSLSIDEVKGSGQNFGRVYFSLDIETKLKDTKDEKGNIVTGLTTDTRYYFMIPLEMVYQTNAEGIAVAGGYTPSGTMKMTMLDTANTAEVQKKSQFLGFEKESDQPKAVTESAKIKVDKILSDIYAGRDISQDFKSYYPLRESQNATYVSLDDFEYHTKNNALGYNARCVYTVETVDGFKYQNELYLAIRQNGSTYTINGVL